MKPTHQAINSTERNLCNYCRFLAKSETWCNERILKYTNFADESKSEDTMCIGFCFRTMLEGGYGSQEVMNGAKNLLLLGLVRGIVALSEYITEKNKYQTCLSASTGDGTATRRKLVFSIFDKESIFRRNFLFGERSIPECSHFGVVPVNREMKHPLFIGAANKSITIKSKFLLEFTILCSSGLAAIIGYKIPMAIQQRSKNNLSEFFGDLATVISVIAGLVLLLTKFICKKWEIVEMLSFKRTACRLSELSSSISGGKSEATKRCCAIDQPEKVLSQWMSWTFTHEGMESLKLIK